MIFDIGVADGMSKTAFGFAAGLAVGGLAPSDDEINDMMLAFRKGVARRRKNKKTAGLGVAGLEVAGLGVLAKPALDTLRHKNETAKAKRHAKFELAGLGILAAHPAYELGRALVKRAADDLGRRLQMEKDHFEYMKNKGQLRGSFRSHMSKTRKWEQKNPGLDEYMYMPPGFWSYYNAHEKNAAGGAAIPDTTGSSPTTSGELERDVSAPGVSGRSWAQLDMDARVEPGSRPRRGRGVPEWVRYLKRMAMADNSVRDG